MNKVAKVSIIGGGRFGTALAKILSENNISVLMWNILDEEVNSINNLNIHPNIGYSKKLSTLIKSSKSLQEVVEYSNYIIISIPSYALGEVLNNMIPLLKNTKKHFINTAKGFHPQSFTSISRFLKNTIPSFNVLSLSTISGPSFAQELLNNHYTQVNILCEKHSLFIECLSIFDSNYFKLIPWYDIEGGEFLSGYKNVVALLSGMLNGYGFTMNEHAVLLTKAFKESKKILYDLNYNPETAMQLCGIGDLILTCGSNKSRNFLTGNKIAESNSVNDIILNIEKNTFTVEGIGNCSIISSILEEKNIDINRYEVFSTISNILQKKCDIRKKITELLASI